MTADEHDQSSDQAADFAVSVSPDFRAWMIGSGVSMALAAKSASKLFLIGPGLDGADISVAERTMPRASAVASIGSTLYVAVDWQIWRFENALKAGQEMDGYDAVFVPKASHVTGDIDVQDMTVDDDGRLMFVNPRFNCLAFLSRDYSFHPIWKPPFISAHVPENRCHLSGLALQDGRPRFATAFAETDTDGAWRDRPEAGVVIDIPSGTVMTRDLVMPTSPRMHGRTLWLQESGTGYLGRIGAKDGTFEPVVQCPGVLNGMTVLGNTAVCTVSKPGDEAAANMPKLTEALTENDIDAWCGVLVVDLTSGKIRHWLRFEGPIDSLNGVALIPGVKRPRAVGFKSDEIARSISLPPDLD